VEAATNYRAVETSGDFISRSFKLDFDGQKDESLSFLGVSEPENTRTATIA
jgi:hypothetical protein